MTDLTRTGVGVGRGMFQKSAGTEREASAAWPSIALDTFFGTPSTGVTGTATETQEINAESGVGMVATFGTATEDQGINAQAGTGAVTSPGTGTETQEINAQDAEGVVATFGTATETRGLDEETGYDAQPQPDTTPAIGYYFAPKAKPKPRTDLPPLVGTCAGTQEPNWQIGYGSVVPVRTFAEGAATQELQVAHGVGAVSSKRRDDDDAVALVMAAIGWMDEADREAEERLLAKVLRGID